MKVTDENWVKAFARQALSDLIARNALVLAGVDKCHRLHFLQMAAEKICKAYLVSGNGHDHVRKTHAYIQRNLPLIARNFFRPEWEVQKIKSLAREIELLVPACDDAGARPDNSEYPWEDGDGAILVPCEYSFPNLDDNDRSIIGLIRLIRDAAGSYVGTESNN